MEVPPENIHDIFISYASDTNDLPAPYQDWVSKFVDALRKTLKVKLGGEKIKIYFDLRTVEPNQPLTEILEACRNSKLFIAITSPAYHLRPWPRQELVSFQTAHPDPRRLFIAELLPSHAVNHLHALQERHKMHFHRFPSSATTRESIPIAPESELFYERISDLSSSICAQLERIRDAELAPTSSGIPQPSPPDTEPLPQPILLAQVTDDLDDERDGIRRYLEQYGIPVLPTQDYPQGGQAFEAAFAKDLKKCTLVVQLLGPRPGRTPPDLKIGYAKHQALATQAARVKLMQWRRSDVNVEQVQDEAHREFLLGETVTASTLEEFKLSVLKHVRRPKPMVREKSDFLVFINAEKSDRPAARKIRDALAQTCSVVLPLEDATGSIQDDFNENLKACDALLLVYGDVLPEWVRIQMRHLLKTRQSVPWGAICYGPPSNKPPVNFSIPGFDELSCISNDGDTWSIESIRNLILRFRP